MSGGGGQAEAPDAIALDDRNQCEVCGMIVSDHPGPNGQIFFRDNSPEGHDNPAWFDAVKACMFPYRFEHESYGWEIAAQYVTDYSVVDWTLSDEHGQIYISSFVAADTFVDATQASYVLGSEVNGAMGPDFIPFSKEADAQAFADEHGGKLYAFEDIGPEQLGREQPN
ncbi:nitrous oxide reductase accessory protein NosL [Halobacteriaceae archaeon GCM10025711]